MDKSSLIKVQNLVSPLIVQMRYSTTQNVTKSVLTNEKVPYLSKGAAHALAKASKEFVAKNLQIVLWDAYRTEDVQKRLQAFCDDDRYVAKKSNHTSGIAVDLTLADDKGILLDMGTDHDDFSEKAHSFSKDISSIQAKNRQILRDGMLDAGFSFDLYEWWHFDFEGNSSRDKT